MHFAEIDVPQDLVAAHAEGEVVFFVGAGASMSSPTNLPSFAELTRRLAHLASVDISDEEMREPDVVLGRLEHEHNFPVHEIVAREIRKGRRRNDLHDALVSLATAGGEARIVTTNYDNHLHRALEVLGLSPAVFEAPALPAGDGFEGLVHLHGRLGQRPDRLVITDGDFGSAYITQGWAPTFLRDLFAKYVVCFVGYSHEDRMMEYLAKGLRSDARKRFIFTENDAADRWSRLHITPIVYPKDQHEKLLKTLQLWGRWARDTPFDRADRIRRMKGLAPPVDPEDHDFLVDSLASSVLAGEVCDLATSTEWIEWMFQQQPTHALLGIRDAPDNVDSHRQVASWIATAGVGEECFEDIYTAVSRSTRTIDRLVVSELMWRLTTHDVESSRLSVWLRWVLAQARTGSVDVDDLERLWGADVSLSWADTMLLLEHLASGWVLEGPSLFGGLQNSKLTLGWGFRNGARRLIRSDPQEIGELLRWLTSYFEHTHLRLTSRAGGFDRWSYGRSSISPHEQDRIGRDDAEDVLIDCARDALAAAHEKMLPVAGLTRATWIDSRAPVLKRLALHDAAVDFTLPAVEQVALVVRDGALFDTYLHHEVYEVLAAAAPHLTDPNFDQLVATVSAGYAIAASGETAERLADEERWRDHKVFNLLYWLLKHRPSASRPAALEVISRLHPEWVFDGGRPDFTHFVSGGSSSIEDEWPWSLEQFHSMVTSDPEDALTRLAEASPADRHSGWWGGGDMVRASVERWPDDGLALWSSALPPVRQCVIAGWSTAPLAPEQMDAITRILLHTDLVGLDRQTANLLHPWSNDPEIRDRWFPRVDARHLARATFTALTVTDSPVADSDLYTHAINSAPGVLTEFWIDVAAHEARTGVFPGGGLSLDVTDALVELLQPSPFRVLVLAPLLGQLDFLFRADPAWVTDNVLPAIDPTVHEWANIESLWAIVLRGRVSEQLLDAHLLNWLVSSVALVGTTSKVAGDLARMAASIAVHSSMDDAQRLEWIRKFIARADVRVAVDWAHDVRYFVQDLEPDARTSLWRRWMRSVLEDRTNGVPQALGAEELTALAGWVGLLDQTRDITAGVERIVGARKGFAFFTDTWGGLQVSDDALRAHPDEWARLLVGLLQRTKTLPAGLGWWLRKSAATLESAGGSPATTTALTKALYAFAQ
jgi:SIR2-like domain/Domain of unknown function (DUF4020)